MVCPGLVFPTAWAVPAVPAHFKRDRSTIEGTEEHEAAKRPRVEEEAKQEEAVDESDDDDDDDEEDDEDEDVA